MIRAGRRHSVHYSSGLRGRPLPSTTAYKPRNRTRPRSHLDDNKYLVTRARADSTGTPTRREGFWRDATCAETGCPHYLYGWTTTLNMTPSNGTPQDNHRLSQMQARAYYIRSQSNRAFTELADGYTFTYRFEAGQKCFKPHRLPVERDPLFACKSGLQGHWQQMEFTQFFDSFNETSYGLNRRIHDG